MNTINRSVRVRYAPSPTGDPHVGNVRTALFNWLYARHTDGVFILRIEDTDQARTAQGALEAIFASLDWLGLTWDEGPRVGGPYEPYVQSQRLAIYHHGAERLLQSGNAYYCYCTPEELSDMRTLQQRNGQLPRYDRRCRQLSQAQNQAKEGMNRVVRFKTQLKGDPISVDDLIRGPVAFDPSLLDDFVILKSDGFPTYHLANVLDDNAMAISHVLRAEEWLPSTPRHLLLYRALEYEPPRFGHLPMILGADRTKLSKRHGATSLLDYRRNGFIPEAMCNFMALLGWSLDDRTDIVSRENLVNNFSLDRVGKSPSIFNLEKLTWMNGVYLRQLPIKDLTERLYKALQSYIRDHPSSELMSFNLEYLSSVTPLVQERLKTLRPDEVWTQCALFLVEWPDYRASLIPRGLNLDITQKALHATITELQEISPFNAQSIENTLRPLAERLQLKTRDLFGIIRVAVTGSTAAPPLFDTMAVLGKNRVLARLEHVAADLETQE